VQSIFSFAGIITKGKKIKLVRQKENQKGRGKIANFA
jgi:hypothetical protein